MKTKNRLAIMQPTYFPWIGYFGLMDSVDTFILLDSVQFARRSWQQRNRIKTPSGPIWLTVPVISKNLRDQLIKDTKIDYSSDFNESHLKSLELNYKKAPFFKDYWSIISNILIKKHPFIADLNEELIFSFKNILGIKTKVILSRDIPHSGRKAELLFNICKKIEATEYISPPGSKDYLDHSDIFLKNNFPLKYFNFSHPEYKQLYNQFIPYLSIVDLLFNEGPKSLEIIRKGCNQS